MRRGSGARPALGAGAAALALLALAACTGDGGYRAYSGHVGEADIVGAWTSNCGASLDISPKGAVTATDFPIAWDDSGNATKVLSVVGTWDLADPSGLQVGLGDYVDTLEYASLSGALGFAYDMMYDGGAGEQWCVFRRK